MKECLGVRLTPEIAELVRQDAEEQDRTVSQIIARIVTNHYQEGEAG